MHCLQALVSISWCTFDIHYSVIVTMVMTSQYLSDINHPSPRPSTSHHTVRAAHQDMRGVDVI